MLEVLDSEFVKLTRIKGLAEWKVIWKHCLRNAAIAPLTFFAIIAGVLMTGAVVTESVFSWPGTGLLVVDAVRARDFQVVQAVVIVFAGIFILTNLLVDILYAYLDPRIRYPVMRTSRRGLERMAKHDDAANASLVRAAPGGGALRQLRRYPAGAARDAACSSWSFRPRSRRRWRRTIR